MSSPASRAFPAQANTGLDDAGGLTSPCPPTSDFMSGKNDGIVAGLGTHGVASVEATADGTEPISAPPATTVTVTAPTPARTAPTAAHCIQRRFPRPSNASSLFIGPPARCPANFSELTV